jgi:hypothetical protein
VKAGVVRIDRNQQIAAIDQFAAAPDIPEGNREAACRQHKLPAVYPVSVSDGQ